MLMAFCFWQVFRADDGTTVPGQGLSLQLRDFAPESCFANISQQTQSVTIVRITCGQLCSYLHDAETRHDQTSATRCTIEPPIELPEEASASHTA